MRLFLVAVALYGAVSLQPRLTSLGGFARHVDAALLGAALALFLVDGPAALWVAGFAGFLADALSPPPFGMATAGFVGAMFLVRAAMGGRPAAAPATVLAGTGTLAFMACSAAVAGRTAWSGPTEDWTRLAFGVVATAAVTSTVAFAAFVGARLIRRATGTGLRTA